MVQMLRAFEWTDAGGKGSDARDLLRGCEEAAMDRVRHLWQACFPGGLSADQG